jgi:hypothetical protein
MIAPYRVAHDADGTLAEKVEATFQWLEWFELSEPARVHVDDTRSAFAGGALDAAGALSALERLIAELDELPTALPPLETSSHLIAYRHEGHPIIRETSERGVQVHTSVRRGLPFMRALAGDALSIEGSAFALVAPVTLPLIRLGRIAKASLSIRSGLATLGWRNKIDDALTHTLAMECLIALRGVRSPRP